MKARTLEELSQRLNDAVAWRRHELKNLQTFFRASKKPLIPLVKASLLLAYSHWEGGVKEMAICYLSFVEQQRCLRRDLKPNFLALSSMTAIRQAGSANSLQPYVQAIEYILLSGDHRYRLPNSALVDTEGNLSSKVLRNILSCVGLIDRWDIFLPKQWTIDFAILAARNSIAHTGRSDRDEIGLDELIEDILQMIDWFRTELENAAATKNYLIDKI